MTAAPAYAVTKGATRTFTQGLFEGARAPRLDEASYVSGEVVGVTGGSPLA